MSDLHEHGFKEVTRVAAARERLREAVTPLSRTDTVPLSAAEGRALAEPVDARRAVPDYRRAAMDGFAVRAADTFGASDRAPEVLREVGDDADPAETSVGPGETTRVHTGSALPDGADAVVFMTDHDEFTELNPDTVAERMDDNVVVDARGLTDESWHLTGLDVRQL